MEKLQEQLRKLQSLKADQNLIDWIEYRIDMMEQGGNEYVVTNENTTEDYRGTLVFQAPQYQQQWVSKPVSYKGFMEWKIDKILED